MKSVVSGVNRRALLAGLAALAVLSLACGGASTTAPRRTPVRTPSADRAILDPIEIDVGHQPAGSSEQLIPRGELRDVGDGDSVNVYDLGEALLSFQDYLQLRIFRNSELTIEQLVNPAAPGVFGVSLIGTAFVTEEASQPPKHVQAITPSGVVIETRGTEFLAHYAVASRFTWVVVRAGEVAVTAGNTTVVVRAGFQTWVEPGRPPAPPVPATRLIVGSRFPLVDDLTGGKIADGEVLSNEQCSASAAIDLFALADAQSRRVGRLPANARFEAVWRTGAGDWVFGVSAATGAAGWAPARQIACRYDIEWLPEEKDAAGVLEVTPAPTPTPTRTPTRTPTPVAFRIEQVLVIDVAPRASQQCPTTFKFAGEITVQGAGAAIYRWEYSDGAVGAERVIRFDKPGSQQVRDERAMSGDFDGAARLRVLRPDDMASKEIAFSLRCPPEIGAFNGMWSINLGRLELAQDGARVTGALRVPTDGSSVVELSIEGTVEGGAFIGSAQAAQPASGATTRPPAVSLKLAVDGERLDGALQSSEGAQLRVCGARTGVPFTDGCGFAGEWMTSLGGEPCALFLTRVDEQLEGKYCNGDVRGEAAFLSGREAVTGFRDGDPRRAFAFYLGANGRQFMGNADSKLEWCGWRDGAEKPEDCFMAANAEPTQPLPAPEPISPRDGSVIQTPHAFAMVGIRWAGVPGAASYSLELDAFGKCARDRWCAEVGDRGTRIEGNTDTDYVTQFDTGLRWRWQVWAVDAAGRPGAKSAWVEFTFQASGADLVISSLELTGRARVNDKGGVTVPVRATVRNRGSAGAPPFKAAARYTIGRQSFGAAFTVPGQKDMWYPSTSKPLPAGASVTFEGVVTLGRRDAIVTLQVEADSCAGQEFAPAACRVEEASEDNNWSEPIKLTLP